MRALFDTCILIDYLNGINEAQIELDLYKEKSISAISWMQVMTSAAPSAKDITKAYLEQFQIIDINDAVRELSIEIKENENLKLPDAITWASARYNNMILVTRNSNNFDPNNPEIRIPYEV